MYLHLIRIFSRKVRQHILISCLSGSCHNKLDTLGTEQFIHDICDQIKPFLVCHTRYHTDQKYVPVYRKRHIFLQTCFVECLSFLIIHLVIMIGQIDIFLWIIFCIIQAI